MTKIVDQGTGSDVVDGFFICSFSAFGDFEGKGLWRYADLSKKWTDLCRDLLVNLGAVFDHQWRNQLSHLRTKVTSADGVGVCTIFIRDEIAASALLMAGKNETAEQEAIRMYASSLGATAYSSMRGRAASGFSKIVSFAERPLMVVVPFPKKSISEQDQELVRELGVHFAAAYFQELR